MNEQAPRRWFRFSLRTLFVVVTVATVPMGWVGYQLNWIRERESLLTRTGMRAHPGYEWSSIFKPAQPPGMLKLFGEKGYWGIIYEDRTPASDVMRARELFPEAEIFSESEYQEWTRPFRQ